MMAAVVSGFFSAVGTTCLLFHLGIIILENSVLIFHSFLTKVQVVPVKTEAQVRAEKDRKEYRTNVCLFFTVCIAILALVGVRHYCVYGF